MLVSHIDVERLRKIRLYKDRGLGCLHPDVVYFKEPVRGFSFWLYYTPYPPDKAELPYLARSNDGFTFSYENVKNPLLKRGVGNEWDSHHIADPDILLNGNMWLMYYAGARYDGERKVVSIGLAISYDGLVWEKYERNPILVADTEAFWEKGSRNVINVSTPTVIKLGKKYYMFYSSRGRNRSYISLALSNDGFLWKKFEGNPVLKPDREFDGRRIDHPKVAKLGDYLFLFYLGRRESRSVLNVAYARIDEPYNLVKYEKNPILTAKKEVIANLCEKLCRTFRINVKSIQKLTRKRYFRALSSGLNSERYWDTWFIYRSTPLTNRDREIVMIKDDITLLYYSAYNYITGLPSIGVALMKIKIK